MKEANNTEECLNILRQMKENKSNSSIIPQLEKIEQYVRGGITSQELLASSGDVRADNIMQGIAYRTLNKIITYKEKDIHYYVDLPEDMFFNTSESPRIISGKLKSMGICGNDMETVGPDNIKEDRPSFDDANYTEITGNFSSIPEGTMLNRSDWFKIISKYPDIYKRMYDMTKKDYEYKNNDSVKSLSFIDSVAKTDEVFAKENSSTNNEKNNEPRNLPQEVIDSIEFETPKKYLTGELVQNGKFGTFQEVLDGKYIPKETKTTTIIDVLKQRFRGVSAVERSDMAFLENEKELMLAKLLNDRAKLLGHFNYQEQLDDEEFDKKSQERGFKSFREENGLPEEEISTDDQVKIDEITQQIEDIERNWGERTND